MSKRIDVQAYYRRITEVDIGLIARELLSGRIVQETPRALLCDCPNHKSQSHKSLQIMLDKQGWYCFGCGVGGDVLQLVEFVRFGRVTSGQSGPMPESHRQARDFLASRAGLPPLGKVSSKSPEEIEAEYHLTMRVREALTALAEIYHQRLMSNSEVLAWFRNKYRIGDEMIEQLKIGYADDGPPSIVKLLTEGPRFFTLRELAATSAFRPTANDSLVQYFNKRIVFPYWSRGHVVYMIGRQTPWTPDNEWEKAKYKKLAVRNERSHSYIAECIRNDVLYNEDVLLTRPESIVITEGVTDCISLMEHGFAAVSPVTVQIRDADWERIISKLSGVKTVYICQDNEISEAGMQGALKTARALSSRGIQARVAILPLSEKQIAARKKLSELPADSPEAEALRADAKIDVNEFFASGKTAADFTAILNAAKTPIEIEIDRLPAVDDKLKLPSVINPILSWIKQEADINQDHYIKLLAQKYKLDARSLKKQMNKVASAEGRGRGRGAYVPGGGGPAQYQEGEEWKKQLIPNITGGFKPVLANALIALRMAPEWEGVLAYNEFAQCTVMRKPAPWMTKEEEREEDKPPDSLEEKKPDFKEWKPEWDILTTEWLHLNGIFVSTDVASQAIEAVAKEHGIHPVREYLESLSWDGQPRLKTWLHDYLGAELSDYTEAVGTKWMISAVARILAPGCKADHCMILEGEQGIGKSTALRILFAPWFSDEIADLGSKDAALQTRGVWGIELAELESMSRAEVWHIKAFISRAVDRFRPPYGRRLIESPRQCVFAGTVNHSQYLKDETGGRRFWPVECGDEIDIEGLKAVKDQLWAEAVHLFRENTPWWLDDQVLIETAKKEQAKRYDDDPWDELIFNYLNGKYDTSIREILTDCIVKPTDNWTQSDKNRVARVLRTNGWRRYRAKEGDTREWRYRREWNPSFLKG